jgi:hypothetical protein
VIAYHSIFGTYGFWLPNDPRGSGSDYVAVWELFRYGPATKTDSLRSVAIASHNVGLRRTAKQALRFAPVELSGAQAVATVRGFAMAAEEGNYRIYACAVLPNHVHMVSRRPCEKHPADRRPFQKPRDDFAQTAATLAPRQPLSMGPARLERLFG